MESSRFHFRDHQEFQSSMHSEPSSFVSSVSSDRGDSEPEIESITGRGIKHLCSELLELKAAASEDLQSNILANYSAFVRIPKEVKRVENELLQLENHFIAHQRLVKNLIDDIYPKILSEEIIDSTFKDTIDVLLSSPSELEVHINDVLEKLDVYLSENRVDEALDLLESSDEYFQNIHFEDHYPESEITLYKSLISKRKSTLIQQLAQIAESSKIAGLELHKALAGIRRLGDNQLSINLLLKHYHLRISTRTYELQWSKSSSNGIYIRELARFVFSTISQASRSFVKLCGENSSYASELEQWTCEETKSFITCLEKYVEGISEKSGGLSNAIKVVQYAVSYCSLLENHDLVLHPYLVRHLCPCMEEVLHIHLNHFKKVIAIFAGSDPWVLERYLVSGLFDGGSSSQAIGQQSEYRLLTSSGRKFITLLQAIVEDISPLIGLQMGSLVIGGLTKLFSEYVVILEQALTYNTSVIEIDTSRIKPAESVPQQVSILASLSTLVQFLSTMGESIFRGTVDIYSNSLESHSIDCQQTQLDEFLLFIEKGSNKLRHQFCQQIILRALSIHWSHEITLASHDDEQGDANTVHNPMPSSVLQILFLELRKLEQLAEGNILKADWLMGLIREMMESIFIWVSQNKNIIRNAEENASSEHDDSKQFVLDVQFLMEIAMYGGYFSDDPLALLSLMKSTFLSAGLDPFKDVDDDGWTIDASTQTIEMLLEIEKTKLLPKEHAVAIEEALDEDGRSAQAGIGVISQEDDSRSSGNGIFAEEDDVTEDESEIVTDSESLGQVEGNRDSVDKNTRTELEDNKYERESNAEHDGIMEPINGTDIGMRGTEDSIRKGG
ncbi:exocyst complex component EXO84B-like [Prosopis cineraria]|uniref:exocyst complex component EXO84B-like n=1 Tax=Prosopis cineraria TaxID=364024 RepID=UPI002410079A|nr:exocyst complex component EXO84B-like [Prosopis cineraria]XP_054804305.1 exocyst complex component EXO84B-like [Prosopis cineraria]